MDTITHVLAPLILTEPIRPPLVPEGRAHPRWRDRAAVVLGASVMDLDGCLGAISKVVYGDLSLYARYHRVATHSILGLLVCVLLSVYIARRWPERWLLPFLRPRYGGLSVLLPSFRRLFGLASIAAALHFVGDAITAWGTLRPFWPFWDYDAQLLLVNSLSWPLLTITVAFWAVQNQLLAHGNRKAAWYAALGWAVACLVFIITRPHIMRPPYV